MVLTSGEDSYSYSASLVSLTSKYYNKSKRFTATCACHFHLLPLLRNRLMSDFIIYNNISYILFDSKAAIIPAGEATFLEGDSASSCSPYR